jgi:hypothetical protein
MSSGSKRAATNRIARETADEEGEATAKPFKGEINLDIRDSTAVLCLVIGAKLIGDAISGF